MNTKSVFSAWIQLSLACTLQTLGACYTEELADTERMQINWNEYKAVLLYSHSPWYALSSIGYRIHPKPYVWPVLIDISTGFLKRDDSLPHSKPYLSPLLFVRVMCDRCQISHHVHIDARNQSLQRAADSLRCPTCNLPLWPFPSSLPAAHPETSDNIVPFTPTKGKNAHDQN